MTEGVRRHHLTMGIGKVVLVNDGATVQQAQVQLSAAETRDAMPMVQNFGFQSNPPPGSDVVFASLDGQRSKAVAIGVNHQASRLTGLPSGASRQHDQGGSELVLNNDNTVTLRSSGGRITLAAPDVFTTANLHVGTGATGSFTTPEGQVVTVRDGIIINIF